MNIIRQTTTRYTLENLSQEEYNVIFNALENLLSNNINVDIVNKLLDAME